jgi:hypothetical protein
LHNLIDYKYSETAKKNGSNIFAGYITMIKTPWHHFFSFITKAQFGSVTLRFFNSALAKYLQELQ